MTETSSEVPQNCLSRFASRIWVAFEWIQLDHGWIAASGRPFAACQSNSGPPSHPKGPVTRKAAGIPCPVTRFAGRRQDNHGVGLEAGKH